MLLFNTLIMAKEIWIPIIGWEKYYMVSSYGRVKSLERSVQCKGYKKPHLFPERILKHSLSKRGYLRAVLHNQEKTQYIMISRIVAIHFIKNINNYPIINHKDGNKMNNTVENLEWCTQQQNVQHAWDNGLCKTSQLRRDQMKALGKIHGGKLAKKVDVFTKTGEYIRSFPSAQEIIRTMGINPYNMLNNKSQKQSQGFIFRYA